jgi:hypothetical protein
VVLDQDRAPERDPGCPFCSYAAQESQVS